MLDKQKLCIIQMWILNMNYDHLKNINEIKKDKFWFLVNPDYTKRTFWDKIYYYLFERIY